MADTAKASSEPIPKWRREAAEHVNNALLVAQLDCCQAMPFGPKLARFYAVAEGLSDEAQAYLGLIDRYFLLVYLLRRIDLAQHGSKGSRWLYERCREVEAEPDDHLDLWAREHYKSSIITFGGIVQEILRDAELTIGIFSFNNKEARKPLRQVKTEFEENEKLKRLYWRVLWENPKKQAPKWSENDGLIVKRKSNPKEPTLGAYGLVDGMPTGSHFGLRVYDDVVTLESVSGPEMVKKVTTARELSDNLGKRGGREWNIGTRYHFGDTYGIFLGREVFKARIYPATDNGTLEGEPVFLTPEEWASKKRKQPSTVAAQMLQNPLAGTELLFDPLWFRGYFCRPYTVNVYILCDPSKGSPNRRSDRTAMAVIAVDANGNKYLVDGFCHRMNLTERWMSLKLLYRKWKAVGGVATVQVGYEQYGMLTDIEHFEHMMKLEKKFFIIKEVSWTRDHGEAKTDRMERLAPDFEESRFFMPAVVRSNGVDCLWGVEESKMVYRPMKGRPTEWAQMEAAQQKFRNIGPIVRKDENNQVYDLTMLFHEELLFAPFAPHEDFTDAASRVYDMDPTPPVVVDLSTFDPPVHVDT